MSIPHYDLNRVAELKAIDWSAEMLEKALEKEEI